MNGKLFLYSGILIILISVCVILLSNLAEINKADKILYYLIAAFGLGTGVVYIRFYKILK